MKISRSHISALSIWFLGSLAASGHGTVTSPISRVYRIYLEEPGSPDTPSAAAAIAKAGSNQYYTWNQVSKNLPNYDSQDLATSYASVIPDGSLASGDNGSGLDFSGMDLVSPDWDWPATSVQAGVLPITWKATAPHDPSFFKVWITTADYDHKQPLSWEKMEFLGRLNAGPGGFTTSGNDYLFNVTLPQRTGRHVLYVAWQRVDPVGECFFSTSDLIFETPPDPHAPPVATISGGTVAEDAGSIDLIVALDKAVANGETSSVEFMTIPGSADGSDYNATSGRLDFLAGEQSKTITVTITDDEIDETDENFSVSLTNPVSATLGANSSATVTITDNDATNPPTGGGSVVYEIRDDWGVGYSGWLRLHNSSPDSWINPVVTFDLSPGEGISYIGPGTATNLGEGKWRIDDLNVSTAPGATLSIDLVVFQSTAGLPRGPRNVRINGVDIDEPTVDPSVPIQLRILSQIVIEGDEGTSDMPFSVVLNRAPGVGETISIDYQAHGHGAQVGDDFPDTRGTLVFGEGEAGKTINVPIFGDTNDEELEIVMIHLTNPTGLVMLNSEATGQIVDDDHTPGGFGDQRIVCYLDATDGQLSLPPADRVTHIMYGFANLNPNGSLEIAGPGFSSLNALKVNHPNLKIALSIGGWNWSEHFSSIASDPDKRLTFAKSCRAAVVANNLDGIDIDWEWPSVPGGPNTNPTPQDGSNYTLLLQALRAELTELEAEDGLTKHYEISAFTAARPSGIAALALPDLVSILDFVNVQGYDLHGPWNAHTGHNAGLFDNSADPGDDRLNIDSVLDQYLAGGFDKAQLLVGAPFYGRTYNGVASTANGAFQAHDGSGMTPLYRDLGPYLTNLPRHWDALAKVPFLYDTTTREWISYDDPQAMYEKAKYSASEGFGGVFYWRSAGDTDDHQLLTTISDTLAKRGIDSDLDGIRDSWERVNFGNLTDADQTTDWDGDGSSDQAESYFKTLPKNGSDFARFQRMTSAEIGNTDRFAFFQTVVGTRFQIETSTDLNTWEEQGGLIEGDGSRIYLEDNDDETPVFYRIRSIGP